MLTFVAEFWLVKRIRAPWVRRHLLKSLGRRREFAGPRL
jgi:hypothetical protein